MMGFEISCSLVVEDKTLLCPLPVPNKTRKFGVGGGTYPQSQGCGAGVCAPYEYFLGYEDFVDIFWGSSQNWTIFRGHFYAFKGLFLRSRYRMGDIFSWGA